MFSIQNMTKKVGENNDVFSVKKAAKNKHLNCDFFKEKINKKVYKDNNSKTIMVKRKKGGNDI